MIRVVTRTLLALGLLSIALPQSPFAAQTRKTTTSNISGIALELIATPAVSGYEEAFIETVRSLLPDWAAKAATIDEIGNLIVTIGSGGRHVLFACPVDENGYVVSQITSDGFIRLQRLTRAAPTPLFDQFHEGQPVLVYGSNGPVNAVIACKSTHLQARPPAESERPEDVEDLWVDVGAHSQAEAERLGVRLLAPIALRERASQLAGGRLAGVHASSRGAAAALLQVVSQLDIAKLEGTVTFAWAVQDVLGHKGLDRLARAIKADHVIIVGANFRPTANSEQGDVGRLGSGPLASDKDDVLHSLAESGSIRHQQVPGPAATPATYTGGPDWSAKNLHSIGLPSMFHSTPVETITASDIEQTSALIAAIANLTLDSSRPLLSHLTTVTRGFSETGAFATLKPLIESYGVSGHEGPVRETVERLLPAWAKAKKPTVDEQGNLVLTFGKGGEHRLFVAHMDEIGYRITAIEPDGAAKVERRGGFFDSLMEAHPVLVHGRGGDVRAVVMPRENYSKASRRNVAAAQVALSFGTDSADQTRALGVAVGDTVTIEKKFVRLAGRRGTGRSIDDRNGCTALLLALKKINPAMVHNTVTFVWSVGEETGLDGAKYVSEKLPAPKYVFAVDTFVSSDSPIESPRFANAAIGGGMVFRALDNSGASPARDVSRLLSIARNRGIKAQYGVTGGGNDGAVFTRFGAVNLPLAWPLRYSHSPAEVIDEGDLDALAAMVAALTQVPLGQQKVPTGHRR